FYPSPAHIRLRVSKYRPRLITKACAVVYNSGLGFLAPARKKYVRTLGAVTEARQQIRTPAETGALVKQPAIQQPVSLGAMAEWLCSGLQIRVPRFDSELRLHHPCIFLQTFP